MNLNAFDIGIIVAYIIVILSMGFIVSRRAGENIDAYFLGKNSLSYYLLGIANASGMFDVSGTMWMVTLFVLYGLKSVWIPWLWPCFNQIFLMVYMSIWLRRSQVMTGAEWIKVRFADSKGAMLSHISVVVFAVISVIGFTAYAFQGIGKFACVILPWDISPHVYAIMIMSVATVYIIVGGMYSVVLNDIIQFVIMTIGGITVAAIAMMKTTPQQIAQSVPKGWDNPFFGWKLGLNWDGLLNQGNAAITKDGYDLFMFFMVLVVFKGVLASVAGPAPNYDMQRILATKSPKEAAMMSWFTNVALFIPRYLLIAGLGILGLVYFSSNLNAMGDKVDFEQITPFVINNFLPNGWMGLVITGLLGAFISTYVSTINAGASYIVKDIYQRYINPAASSRLLVIMSYFSSILVVIVGILFGLMTKSINDILQWIVAGLFGGYIAPNVLKWHWWRFNGYGYFWGMVGGIGSAMILFFPGLFPDLKPIIAFPIILAISGTASLLGTLLSAAEDMELLKTFYQRTRPWGFWGPVREAVIRENPSFVPNNKLGRDAVNIVVGVVWQLSMCVLPMYLVVKNWMGLCGSILVLAVTSVFLKFNWYNKLDAECSK